jgi:nucleoid DNA-binding protein
MFDKSVDPMLQTERIRISSFDPDVSSRVLLKQRLTNNIKKYSRLIRNIGGVTIACINQDFINELITLFIESLIEVSMEKDKINFDQFGTFEIVTYKNKLINTVYTGFKDYIIPEAKIIRFHPLESFKNRIKGTERGFKVKHFDKEKSAVIYSDYELREMAKERGIDLDALIESCKPTMVKGAVDMDKEEVEYLHTEEGMNSYRYYQDKNDEEYDENYSAEEEEEIKKEEEEEYKEYFIEGEKKDANTKR